MILHSSFWEWDCCGEWLLMIAQYFCFYGQSVCDGWWSLMIMEQSILPHNAMHPILQQWQNFWESFHTPCQTVWQWRKTIQLLSRISFYSNIFMAKKWMPWSCQWHTYLQGDPPVTWQVAHQCHGLCRDHQRNVETTKERGREVRKIVNVAFLHPEDNNIKDIPSFVHLLHHIIQQVLAIPSGSVLPSNPNAMPVTPWSYTC